MIALKIKAAFQDYHDPLSADERRVLEEEIVAHGGARDPISIWRGFIADGHNRYAICTKHNLPYATVDLTERFGEAEEVQAWIIRNQIGRRNLTAEKFAYNVGRLYNLEKGAKGGDKKSENQTDKMSDRQSASEKIAKETGVSSRTVERAAKKADALDSMPKALKESILDGKVKATDKAVKAFVAADESKQQEAARAVRTGQAPSLDVAMGIKAAKKETTPKAAPAPKNGAAKPDVISIDGKLDDLFGKLIRAVDDRADASEKGPHHRRVVALLNEVKNILTKWQKGITL
jgi:hypothetical protein